VRTIETILAVLLPPRRNVAPVPELPRLIAGEALVDHVGKLTAEERLAVVGAIGAIARDSTLPLHRMRAAVALLRMGVEEFPAEAAETETTL